MQGKPLFPELILLLGLVLFFLLPFLTEKAAGDILTDRQEIESLIGAGKLTEAQAQIDKLKADYSQDSGLPEALYWIAEKYRWEHKWEQAINLHNQIMQNYPNSTSASRANLGMSRAEVLSLLVAEDYEGAQQALNGLLADFTGEPDMPETLYWIAERYKWKQKYERAMSIHQQIVQNYPDSPFASKARLGLIRTEILSLIENRQYEQADEAIEKMITGFAGHPDLPGTLYQIAEGYRWVNKYEKAKELHKRIAQNYPDSPNADKAKIGLAGADILSLIISRDYEQAGKVLDKLCADFTGHPDLPDTLYWIAKSYRWSDRYEKSKELFKRIIQEYPRSSAAGKARQQFNVVVEGMDVFALIESGREQEAQDAINKLIVNPAENENDEISAYTVFLCGDRYYAKGLQKKEQGHKDEAAVNFIKAIDIWGQMIQQLPACKSKALAYYRTANCYVDLGQYDRAVEKYTELLKNYPDYYLAWDAQFRIGRCYQSLKENNIVDRSSADAHTKAAYEAVLEKYPGCPVAKVAENWVKKHAK
jgi:TolA-binding protein